MFLTNTFHRLVLQHKSPVSKENFKAHLHYLQANGNFLFSQQYEIITSIPEHPHDHSLEDDNISKNRYANVSAYDDTRVVLDTIDGFHSSDYINANYICGRCLVSILSALRVFVHTFLAILLSVSPDTTV